MFCHKNFLMALCGKQLTHSLSSVCSKSSFSKRPSVLLKYETKIISERKRKMLARNELAKKTLI